MRFASSSLSIILLLAGCASTNTRALSGPDKALAAQDYVTAYEGYNALAAKGDPAAERQLGYMYENGLGVHEDFAQSVVWFRKAADAGDASAESELGYSYEHGHGVQQDYAQAFEWYSKAAAQGVPSAENNLGYDYQRGRGVAVDYAKAFHWYTLSAKHGDAAAGANLGYMLVHGLGTKVDMAAGVQWYQLAAQRDNLDAELFLAECYTSGRCGLPQNATEAQIYFSQAADHKVRNSAEYGHAVRNIVYAHRIYPHEEMAQPSGTVRVGFVVPDRKAEDVKVTGSSTDAALDAAARQAVLDSYFPVRPASVAGDAHQDLEIKFDAPAAQAAPAATTVAAPAAASH